MDKPDFGMGAGRHFLIKWDEQRVTYVRKLAGEGKSASQIAIDIGLKSWQGPRIAAVCKRFNIALNGRAGRPAGATHFARVEIGKAHRAMLKRLAARHDCPPHVMLTRLVDAMLEQGETFAINLLDGE
jgi:hypothetical protein